MPLGSVRLPTGRSSLEKASGWMRMPLPAAGMMPHMSGGLLHAGRLECGDHAARAMGGGMLVKCALTRAAGDAAQDIVGQAQGGQRVLGAAGQQDFLTRR